MAMSSHVAPLVDDQNPLYCPGITADAYLQSLRTRMTFQNVRSSVPRNQDLSQSFAHVFGRLSNDEDSSSATGENTFSIRCNTGGQGWFSSQSPSEDLPPYSPISSARNQHISRKTVRPIDRYKPLAKPESALKRKDSFSDFDAPPKYARSLQSPDDSSFDVDACHETLHYDAKGSTPIESKQAPKGHTAPENDDIGTLVENFDVAFPGIRLKEKLNNPSHTTAQDIADILADHGYINELALKLLRYTDVKCIVFTPSMFDENGLNLVGDDIYSIFGYADNFRSLTELSFAGIHIRDSDLQHVHHLPNLSVLHLNETGIGNEGVFLLVSLKRTLTKLFLTANPDVNNDAVPAVFLLTNLFFLSILDTGIDMVGLRRLAEHMHKKDHVMDIEIPFACEAYVDNIASRYLINLFPPLITNPRICGQLSSAALKRNLEAHAERNSSIIPSGTRPEMLQRLFDILEIRQLDLLVLGMLEGSC